jgi:hypothetical protein
MLPPSCLPWPRGRHRFFATAEALSPQVFRLRARHRHLCLKISMGLQGNKRRDVTNSWKADSQVLEKKKKVYERRRKHHLYPPVLEGRKSALLTYSYML